MGIPGRKARWHPAQGLIWSVWKELFPMPIRDQIQFLTATSPCWLSAQTVFATTIAHQAVFKVQPCVWVVFVTLTLPTAPLPLAMALPLPHSSASDRGSSLSAHTSLVFGLGIPLG